MSINMALSWASLTSTLGTNWDKFCIIFFNGNNLFYKHWTPWYLELPFTFSPWNVSRTTTIIYLFQSCFWTGASLEKCDGKDSPTYVFIVATIDCHYSTPSLCLLGAFSSHINVALNLTSTIMNPHSTDTAFICRRQIQCIAKHRRNSVAINWLLSYAVKVISK